MDVEYIALDDADEFITQGRILDIGKRYILVSNWGFACIGNIFVFDRKTGEGLRIINRRGQGGEEYTRVGGAILDEDNGEIFVRDSETRRILVYDLYGNFRRRFNFIGDTGSYVYIFNYDQDNFLVYKAFPFYPISESTPSSFLIISKQDGSLVREIYIPTEEFRTPIIVSYRNRRPFFTSFPYPAIIPYRDGWALMQASSDTIYHLSNGDLIPLIARTPSIHSMRTELFLFPSILTDRYYFMQIHRSALQSSDRMIMYPRINLMYDRQESAVFRVTVYNDDFSNRRSVGLDIWLPIINHEVAFFERFEAYQLIEAYENGELRGRLKEVASKLNEDSNPVIMLVTHRR